MNAVKKGLYFSLSLFLFIACEDDLKTVNVGFLGDRSFETRDTLLSVSSETVVIDSVLSNSLIQYLLGVYNDPSFGTLKASFASQLNLPSDLRYTTKSFASDTLVKSFIDAVVLYIPYQSTLIAVENGLNIYELDGVFGTGSFDLEVAELQSFLRTLDPSGEPATYYSNKDFLVNSNDPLLSQQIEFEPSASDTVSYISRKINNVVYDTDTVKFLNGAPRMAIPLNTNFFKEKILDKLPGVGETPTQELSTQEDFSRYFKGLYIKTVSDDNLGSMLSLKLSDAFVEMYYTNIVSTNGKNLDTIKKTKTFAFGSVKANVYEHDHLRASEQNKLYIQGTSGFQANINILGYDKNNPNAVSEALTSLRASATENGQAAWLINEASLKFYVDASFMQVARDTVFRLFLYKKTPNSNTQLLDYIPSPNTPVSQGKLLKDENDAHYYEFEITDYISNLLDSSNNRNVDNLGLKVYVSGDFPTTANDTLVNSRNWDPRGVVLDTDKTEFKINYSTQLNK